MNLTKKAKKTYLHTLGRCDGDDDERVANDAGEKDHEDERDENHLVRVDAHPAVVWGKEEVSLRSTKKCVCHVPSFKSTHVQKYTFNWDSVNARQAWHHPHGFERHAGFIHMWWLVMDDWWWSTIGMWRIHFWPKVFLCVDWSCSARIAWCSNRIRWVRLVLILSADVMCSSAVVQTSLCQAFCRCKQTNFLVFSNRWMTPYLLYHRYNSSSRQRSLSGQSEQLCQVLQRGRWGEINSTSFHARTTSNIQVAT